MCLTGIFLQHTVFLLFIIQKSVTIILNFTVI